VLNNPATIGETYLVADLKPLTIRKLFAMLDKGQGRGLGSSKRGQSFSGSIEH
jgi:hypothetical protein